MRFESYEGFEGMRVLKVLQDSEGFESKYLNFALLMIIGLSIRHKCKFLRYNLIIINDKFFKH